MDNLNLVELMYGIAESGSFAARDLESVRGLEIHHGKVHEGHRFECGECCEEFETKRALHIHQGEIHDVE